MSYKFDISTEKLEDIIRKYFKVNGASEIKISYVQENPAPHLLERYHLVDYLKITVEK